MSTIPLVERAQTETFARLGKQQISVGQFCADVRAIAQQLPQSNYLINLCQDRYLFTATFFAALTNLQTNLLPSKREANDAKTLAQQYGNCAIVTDQPDSDFDLQIQITPGNQGQASTPLCPGEHTAAVAFTSGSTGEPQAHAKSWCLLDTWRRVHLRYLSAAENAPSTDQQDHNDLGVVATVPSWHMYGLEWALLLPTVAHVTLHCGADFYPQDVLDALHDFNCNTLLVTTPVHLRALTKIGSAPGHPLPRNLAYILSATAPLDKQLVDKVEALFATRLFEIYGCSEIGSLAYRFPSTQQNWTFFDCFDLDFDGSQITVNHPLLDGAVTLADAFAQHAHDTYELLGRSTDIIKVGGKRESLANLNTLLTSIPGVEDGIIYQPQTFGLPASERLGALVKAPGLDNAAIRAGLAQHVDAAFLPRPIYIVDTLPRDTTSKLKHAELAKLLQTLATST